MTSRAEPNPASSRTLALPRSNRAELSILLSILFITFAIYYPALHSEFVYDDFVAIAKNEAIQSDLSIKHLFDFESETPLSGRPLVALSFFLNYKIFGLNTSSYKLANIVIHLFNIFLVFMISRKIANQEISNIITRSMIIAISSLAWAIHPINTEAIIYTTQRTELLSALFILTTIYICSFSPNKNPHTSKIILAGCSSALAALCKESAIIIPLIVVLIDKAYTTMTWKNLIGDRKWLYLTILCNWLIAFPIILQGPRSSTVGWNLGLDWFEYFGMQLIFIPHYVKLIFWPSMLLIHYPEPNWSTPSTYIWPTIFWSLFTLASMRAIKNGWKAILPIAACLVLLAPTSSFLPIISEFAAERRMYLPSAICLFSLFFVLRKSGPVVLFTASAVLVALGIRTQLRIHDYRPATTLWEQVLEHHPNDAIALGALGDAYYTNQNYEKALSTYQRIFQLGEGSITSVLNAARIHLDANSPSTQNDELAHSLATAAREIAKDNAHTLPPRIKLETLSLLAETSLAIGEYQNAKAIIQEGLDLAATTGQGTLNRRFQNLLEKTISHEDREE